MKFIHINDQTRINLAHIADFWVSINNGNMRLTFTHNKIDEDWECDGVSIINSDTIDIYPSHSQYDIVLGYLTSCEL